LRLRPYSDFKESNDQGLSNITEKLLGWWETPVDINGNKYIRNDVDYNNNLVLTSNDVDQEFIKDDSYVFNIEESQSTAEVNRSLPFGGFPGTDGFDFSRNI